MTTRRADSGNSAGPRHSGDDTSASCGLRRGADKEYRLASSVGRPADLCLALSRLIVRGILEDFSRAKIVGSHGGGGICEVIGRLDYAYELQDESFLPRLPMSR